MGSIFTICCNCSRKNQRNDNIFEGILEQECVHWDAIQKRFLRTIFFVTQPKNNIIYYVSDDGSILRSEKIRNQQLQQSEILTNNEHIKYLQWIGEYGNNLLKIGRWRALWQGEALIGIGGAYSEDGKKQGQWHQLFQNFSKQFQVYESGEYLNDQRIGQWKYTLENEEIGGGSYDNQGKQGQWIELTNNFLVKSQITVNGEYKNGKKVGRWDYYYRRKIHQQFELIGGGSYNQEGKESFKIGKWFEPSDGFHSDNQIVYVGEYQKGIRVGKWEIQMLLNDYGSIQQIGVGEYDDGQEDKSHLGMKQGKWHELSGFLQNSSKVIYFGEYKNDIKIGRWEIYWKKKDEKSFKLIGGGLYQDNIEGEFPEGIKQGRWVELSEGFRNSSIITYKGDYQNNNKVGRWNIRLEWKNSGGGSYDEIDIGFTNKNGKWIEFSNRFDRNNQLICRGEYKNGKKIGRWHWQLKYYAQEIGGGYYDEEGHGIKIGKWIDLDDEFYEQKQITYHGEYQNGKKIGRWNTWLTSRKQIGGGCYDEECHANKVGKWIDLDDRFYEKKQITYHGEYLNGRKIGRWNTCLASGEQIGGGSYDDKGEGIKIGKWIDISDRYDMNSQVIQAGEYKYGKKFGLWTILHWNYEMNNYQQIGGGLYDERDEGIKIGKWIYLDQKKNKEIQIIYYGEYKLGKKVGRWDIVLKKVRQPYEQITGGFYDYIDSVKIGKWIEYIKFDVNKQISEKGFITHQGNYENGKRAGIWIVFWNDMEIAKIQYKN